MSGGLGISYSEKLVFAELPTLLFRRNCARVTVLYKILNKLIDFPSGYIEERVTSISYQLRDFQCRGQDSLSLYFNANLNIVPTGTSIISIVGQLSMILKCGFVNVALLT